VAAAAAGAGAAPAADMARVGSGPASSSSRPPSSAAAAARSRAAKAAAEEGRRAGSLARAASQASARRAGTQGASRLTGNGWSWRCALATSAGEPPENGGRPHSSSYSTAPSEYTSEAGVAGWPATRSGET
jgi:hypothetical protein